jgi:hypothetical protein
MVSFSTLLASVAEGKQLSSGSGLLGSLFAVSLLLFVGLRNRRGLSKLRGLNGIRAALGLIGGPFRGLRGAARKNLNLSLFMMDADSRITAILP